MIEQKRLSRAKISHFIGEDVKCLKLWSSESVMIDFRRWEVLITNIYGLEMKGICPWDIKYNAVAPLQYETLQKLSSQTQTLPPEIISKIGIILYFESDIFLVLKSSIMLACQESTQRSHQPPHQPNAASWRQHYINPSPVWSRCRFCTHPLSPSSALLYC